MTYGIAAQWVLASVCIVAALVCRKSVAIQGKWLWIGCFWSERKGLLKAADAIAPHLLMRCRHTVQRQVVSAYGREAAEQKLKEFYAEMWTCTIGGLWMSGAGLLLLSFFVQGERMAELWILCVGSCLLLPFMRYLAMKDKAEKRLQSIQLEFPVYAHKIILLTKAGLVLSNAWQTAIDESRTDREPLYQELAYCRKRIKDGAAECEELEEMARSIHIKEIVRMMNFITVNLKRGDREILAALYAEIQECYEMKRRVAKRAGEKAGIKMMIPLTLSLIAMLLTVATPAILSMSNI